LEAERLQVEATRKRALALEQRAEIENVRAVSLRKRKKRKK